MFVVKRSRVVSLFSLAGLLFATACDLEEQKASSAFEDARLPANLGRLANPDLSTEQVNSLKESTLRTKLPVAVIDLGVDYLHPKLIQQTYANFQDQELKGIGFDLMGQDNFAHPNLVAPKFFAFGAKEIRNGKIIGALANPLRRLSEWNQQFSVLLRQAILSHPVLKNSLYQKLGTQSLNVMGAYNLVHSYKFDLEYYEEQLAAGLVYKLTPTPEQLNPANKRYLGREALRSTYDYEWALNVSTGAPYLSLDLHQMEHAPIFREVLTKTLSDFSSSTSFGKDLQSYFDYRWAREVDTRPEDREDSEGPYASDLREALGKFENGWDSSVALADFSRYFCTTILPDNVYASIRNASTVEERHELAANYIKSVQSLEEPLARFVLSNPSEFSKQDVKNMNDVFKRGKDNAAQLKVFMKLAGKEALSCKSLDPTVFLPNYAKSYVTRFRGSYLASQSVEATHGSHVAGIVASQHSGIGIVPVRVTTESVDLPPQRVRELQQSFKTLMRRWIQIPVVNLKMQRMFSKIIPSQSPAEFSDRFVSFWEESIQESVRSNTLDHVFVDDMAKAIVEVGNARIKIANISLGTSFAEVPNTLGLDLEQDPKRAFQFIQFEVFKHHLGKMLRDKAPGTLFVVAAGNEGNWVDGRSRSALPCDVSSPFFEDTEKELGTLLDNNNVRNVLCVGSIGKEKNLSSFTNITLTKVPFVLSYGEGIESSLRVGDCEGATPRLKSRVGETFNFPYLRDTPAANSFLDSVGFVKTKPGIDVTRVDNFNEAVPGFSSYIDGTLENSYCYATLSRKSGQMNHSKLTGTSMASPAVAGFVAKQLIENLEAGGLALFWNERNRDALYGSPEQSPEMLIERLMGGSPTFGGSTQLSNVHTVVDVKNWTPESGNSIIPMQLAMFVK